MTLKDHLLKIGEALASKGANEKSILFFQLYLLCLGWDGFLYPDDYREGITKSKGSEPYSILLKKTPLSELWSTLYDNHHQGDPNTLDSFFDDDDILWRTPRGAFREMFINLLNTLRPDEVYPHFNSAELAKLAFLISAYEDGMTVYNPFAGIGSYATFFKAGNNYYGEELDPVIWGIGVLWNHVNGSLSSNYLCGNSLNSLNLSPKEPFDIIVTTLPLFSGYSPSVYVNALSEPTILKKGGSLIIITRGSLIKSSFTDIATPDMVVILPDDSSNAVSEPLMIVRIKNGQDKSTPIQLIDGTSFCSTDDLGLYTIDVHSLFIAIYSDNPNYTVKVSRDELANSHLYLSPAFYFSREDKISGKKMMPLGKLGTFTTPSYTNHPFKQVIRVLDLSNDPLFLDISASERSEHDYQLYGTLDNDALLIGGNATHPSFGYFRGRDYPSVGISSAIFAFIPNEHLVSLEYVAFALSQKGVFATGSDPRRIFAHDLFYTTIPVLSKEEQQKTILAYRHSQQRHNRSSQIDFVRLVLIGNPPTPAETPTKIIRRYDRISNTFLEWIRNDENKKSIDAIIVKQTHEVSCQDIFSLCTEEKPVFILTEDSRALEACFGNHTHKYLPNRCFSIGNESELYSALFQLIEEQARPKSHFLEVFSRQLLAAAKLDGQFRYSGFCLRDKLELLLSSSNNDEEFLADLRKIRDHCILDPLIDFGYLPKQKKCFTYGAEVEFLSKRVYSTIDGTFILIKNPFPKHLVDLLYATSSILNEGAHELSLPDKNVQYAVLQIIMACICCLSDLVQDGLFDHKDWEKVNKQYVGWLSDYSFESGIYLVQSLKEDSHYLFAGNTHLSQKECESKSIHPGDLVEITAVQQEKKPIITDYERVLFFSSQFKKIK